MLKKVKNSGMSIDLEANQKTIQRYARLVAKEGQLTDGDMFKIGCSVVDDLSGQPARGIRYIQMAESGDELGGLRQLAYYPRVTVSPHTIDRVSYFGRWGWNNSPFLVKIERIASRTIHYKSWILTHPQIFALTGNKVTGSMYLPMEWNNDDKLALASLTLATYRAKKARLLPAG